MAVMKGINVSTGFEIIPPRPMTTAELSERYPLDEIARRGGGVLNSVSGTSKVDLMFSPRAGYVTLRIDGKSATVHKDELLYFIRFAKGSTAV